MNYDTILSGSFIGVLGFFGHFLMLIVNIAGLYIFCDVNEERD